MTPDPFSDAEAILRAAIAAADPGAPLRRALARAPELERSARVHVIAIGKAACRMAEGAAEVLRGRVAGRLVVVPHGTVCRGALHAAHPVPDVSSAAAGHAVAAAIDRAEPQALLLVLLSGGASALATLPAGGIRIQDYAHCVDLLQRAGADIRQLNTVRKHIDLLKGGRLARLAAPRRVLGLLLSDVVGDPIDVIASGPLAADPTTFDDAIAVLRERGVWESCPESIRTALLRGAAGLEAETPKQPQALAHVRSEIIGGNALALDGAAAAARELGYHTIVVAEPITGEARVAGAAWAARARETHEQARAGAVPLCLIAGGETTVTVRGGGRGGRNQELVLAAALALDGVAGVTVGSAGTDGLDGNSDAAGAIADAELISDAARRGCDARAALDHNDSYNFFRAAGGLLITGPTGTNVMDVQIALLRG